MLLKCAEHRLDSTSVEKTLRICGHTTTTSSWLKRLVGVFFFAARLFRSCSRAAFNLINDVNKVETEAQIAKFRAENAAIIALNVQRDEQAARALQEQEAAARAARTERATALQAADAAEAEARERERATLIDRLEASDKDAGALVARAKADAHKRRAVANADAARAQRGASVLRARAAQSRVQDEPHVALDDSYYAYEDRVRVRASGYNDPASEAVRRDQEGIMRAGGYRVEEAWERALRYAVAGLDLAPLSGLPGGPPLASDAQGDVVMASV
jgi:CDK-activating kinase assembly factor MAT1